MRTPTGTRRKIADSRSNLRLDRQAWIEAARDTLIEGGVERVKVEPLATKLGVTTGGFYWHFKDRDDLLSELIKDWMNTNSAALERAVAANAGDAQQAYETIARLWLDEKDFSPSYDGAMREWARSSKAADRAVRAVDKKRIALLRTVFEGLGYAGDRAEVRARIMYYHQVGYYALNVSESKDARVRLRPLYDEVLRDGVGKRRK